MNNVPTFISVLFILTTLITAWQFYDAAARSKTVLIIFIAWLTLTAVFGIAGFYQVTGSIPPRFFLLLGPGLIFALFLFITKKGRNFLDGLNIRKLTILHTIRIPVEATLYFVCAAGYIPELMTFEGNNFDIISGITAPVIFYLVFVYRKLNYTALLAWNFLCLCLLINVVTIAILAAQTPFQKLAFDQPNVGITYFPYVWLPALVVPLVLISHLSAIRQLIIGLKQQAVKKIPATVV